MTSAEAFAPRKASPWSIRRYVGDRRVWSIEVGSRESAVAMFTRLAAKLGEGQRLELWRTGATSPAMVSMGLPFAAKAIAAVHFELDGEWLEYRRAYSA